MLREVIQVSPRSKVIAWFDQAVREGTLSAGHTIPAERDLAVQLGVARKTVRAALDDLQRAGRVVQMGDGQRRQVADLTGKRMSRVLAKTVLLLGSPMPAIDMQDKSLRSNELLPIKLDLVRTVERSGLHVVVMSPENHATHEIEELIHGGLRGIIVSDEWDDSPAAWRSLQKLRGAVPIIVRGYAPALAAFDRVISDHAGGAYDLTKWLIGKGCQRILRFHPFPEHRHWLDLRDMGHEKAMDKAHLAARSVLRMEVGPTGYSQDDFDRSVSRMADVLAPQLKGGKGCDAIMTPADGLAHYVVATCRKLGLKPNEDVLISGYDNHGSNDMEAQWESMGPMVTIDKHNECAAAEMTQLLQKRVEGKLPSEPQRVVIPHALVVCGE